MVKFNCILIILFPAQNGFLISFAHLGVWTVRMEFCGFTNEVNDSTCIK